MTDHSPPPRRTPGLTRRQLLAFAGGSALLPLLHPAPTHTAVEHPPLIVDGHLDLGWNMANYGRDYTRSAHDTRRAPDEIAAQDGRGRCMVGLPELIAGRVALVVGVIFVMPAHLAASPATRARYTTPAEASAWGQAMLAQITALAVHPQIALVRTAAELDGVLATWRDDQPPAARQVGIILGMEGADPITTPDEVAQWHARGLRSIGLSWGRTRYAGSNLEPGSLSAAGAALLAEMAAYGMLLDTAHLAEAAFWAALDQWDGPIAYTHGNSRRFLPGERGLSDAQILALAGRGGVIGIGLYTGFFQRGRLAPDRVTLDDVANAIDTVAQITGSAQHVALGTDVDGGFGAELAPVGIDTVADLPALAGHLAGRGFSAADLDAVLHGNWLRVLRRTLPAE